MRLRSASIFFLCTLFGFFPPASSFSSGFLISQDLAVREEGEFHSRFLHLKEPDGDASQIPGTENQFALRLLLDPHLIFDDFTEVFARLEVGDPELLLGEGGSALTAEHLGGKIPLSLTALGVHLQTPLGALLMGRIPFHYGLGVFYSNGRSSLSGYGIPLSSGTDDQIRFSFAPFGAIHPLKVTLLLRSFAEGSRSTEGIRKDGIGYGGELSWEEGENRYTVWGDYEVRSTQGTYLGFLDLFLSQRFSFLRIRLEAGARWGRWGGIPGVELNQQSLVVRTLDRLGAGGVLQVFAVEEVKSGGTTFAESGLEVGWFSGDRIEEIFTGGRSRWFSSHPDYTVGLLLFSSLWPSRLTRLNENYSSAYREILGGGESSLKEAFQSLVPSGIGNAFYLFPGFSLKTADELRFRLNLLYARSILPVPTLKVIDTRGTLSRADDLYQTGHEYGFEIDAHLSYPVWGGAYGILEAGVAFPGDIFRNASGEKPPTAFGIFPRLTIFF